MVLEQTLPWGTPCSYPPHCLSPFSSQPDLVLPPGPSRPLCTERLHSPASCFPPPLSFLSLPPFLLPQPGFSRPVSLREALSSAILCHRRPLPPPSLWVHKPLTLSCASCPQPSPQSFPPGRWVPAGGRRGGTSGGSAQPWDPGREVSWSRVPSSPTPVLRAGSGLHQGRAGPELVSTGLHVHSPRADGGGEAVSGLEGRGPPPSQAWSWAKPSEPQFPQMAMGRTHQSPI